MTKVTGHGNKTFSIILRSIGSGSIEFHGRLLLRPGRMGRSGIVAAPRQPRHAWLTTACGQRFSLNQIGSVFGRE